MPPKVSIIITSYNYAEYLPRCLDSALNQTYDDYEVVVVDDGSTDDTQEILKQYSFRYPDKLRTVHLEGRGLPGASNAGIEVADGDYIVRLDADDYFDENILTVEATFLDAHPEIDMVYPDYYTVDDDGQIIDHVRLPKVQKEVKLLNRSPLAAGAMYRRQAWESIDGYDESLDYQEDYDFWIRFINEFEVRNVNLPLMYYRQHDSNMSQNLSGRLEARYEVKRKFVEQNLADKNEEMEILCVIPAREETRVNEQTEEEPLSLWSINDRPLIEYTIREAIASDRIDRTLVSTESERIAKTARGIGADVPFLRPEELTGSEVSLSEVVYELLSELDIEEGYSPDLIVLAQYLSPLRTAAHFDEAVDTFFIFPVDSVISVTQNRDFFWQPGEFGLSPLFDQRLLREEREALYRENAALYVFTPSVLREKRDIIGDHVGHIEMERKDSIHIDTHLDLAISEMILNDRSSLAPEYRSDELHLGGTND